MPPILQVPKDVHVRRSGADYAKAFLDLLPYGQAWPRDVTSTLVLTVNGLAEYYGTCDARAADLLEQESDPRKTIELLSDWERNWGLPDPCFKQTPTIGERQRMLVFKMTMMGGQSRDFFITDVAKNILGYDVTISEYAPFMAGVSNAGDTRSPPADQVNLLHGDFRWYIGPQEMRFYWTVHVGQMKLVWFRCGGGGGQAGVDHHLEIGKADDLECLFNRWKPAHTQIVFDYSGVENPGDPMAGTP